MGEANISVLGSNMCGVGPESESLVVILDNTTSVNEASGLEVNVYPNPNTGVFKLKLNSMGSENIKLSIRNMMGESVVEEEHIVVDGEFNKTFNLEEFAEGIYFLVLDNGKFTWTEKIVLRK